ncbi:MAG: RibD family protein [Candidatus Methylacidiphilales bacterium]
MLDDQERRQVARQRGRPWVIGKAGMSRNGCLTRPPGEGTWITSEAARQDVQRLRAACDAVLVGAETARKDNPRLTVRDFTVPRQPWRVILSRSGNLPAELCVLTDEHRSRTLICADDKPEVFWSCLRDHGVEVLLVEGGGRVLDDWAGKGWIDEVVIYEAPFDLQGEGLVKAERFRLLLNHSDEVEELWIGEDRRISGRVRMV